VVPLAVFAVGWVLLGMTLARLMVPAWPRSADQSVSVPSIVIPARNEVHNLPGLLDRLDGVDVVVVDDHSTDATGVVARSLGATVVESAGMPGGWRGKPWACHQGVAAVHGEVLAFIDADVRIDAATLRTLASFARDGSLVSVQPWHDAGPTFEQLSLIPNLAALLGCGAFAVVPTRRRLAFGPVLVTTRAAYERSGGFAAVANATVEDAALARRYERVRTFSGRQVATFRMHRTPREFVNGWTRVLRRGVSGGSPFGVVATAVWIGALIAGFTSLWLYLANVLLLAVVSRLAGRFRWYSALLFPVPLVVFVLLCVRSLVVRNVEWRGRTVSR
jgi:4,4'-diaponeurosporenoate glycosyltransferase